MLDNQTEPRPTTPLLSIIIPLEYHRGQWERCWQAWQSQTLDRDAFEIILVVPPDFPDRDRLRELADPTPRLEYSQHSHDINLCAVGAAAARGEFLFFTESHCWPEPDVLELCLQAFGVNPDWAAFSCKSVRITHNRLSEAEADMYDGDIEYGMKIHPWRKILDQCFVTRREAYDKCGGLNPEFGHFSEWVLAAAYFECGQRIGYLPEARIHHYYVGSLSELRAFTLDFVEGEIRYFEQDLRGPGGTLLEMPVEWICQDNFNRDMARGILRMALQDLIGSGASRAKWGQAVSAIWRWSPAAISGDGIARSTAAGAAFHAYLAALLALVVGPRKWLSARFRLFIAALIRHQRLTCIRTARLHRAAAGLPGAVAGLAGDAVLDQTGFYPLETYQGSQFRWSENAAAIRLRADAGRQSVHIKCVPVRDLSEIDVRFFLDGKPVAHGATSTGAADFAIRIDPPQSGARTLGWICRPFEAKADSRRLGLPIMSVALTGMVSAAVPAGVSSLSLPA